MRETRSNEKPQEAPRERAPESASFDTTRVGGPRFQPPIVVAGFLVLLLTIVGVGVGGQVTPAPTPPPIAALASGGVPAPTAAPPSARPTAEPPRGPRATPPAPVPVRTSGPGPIQLLAQRGAAGIFVHGDVFVPRVTWVYVSLVDDTGNVAGWASVSVPGATGPGQGSGPTLRFDVEVAIPAGFNGRLWVSANAYDQAGALIAGTRLEADPLLRPRMQFEP